MSKRDSVRVASRGGAPDELRIRLATLRHEPSGFFARAIQIFTGEAAPAVTDQQWNAIRFLQSKAVNAVQDSFDRIRPVDPSVTPPQLPLNDRITALQQVLKYCEQADRELIEKAEATQSYDDAKKQVAQNIIWNVLDPVELVREMSTGGKSLHDAITHRLKTLVFTDVVGVPKEITDAFSSAKSISNIAAVGGFIAEQVNNLQLAYRAYQAHQGNTLPATFVDPARKCIADFRKPYDKQMDELVNDLLTKLSVISNTGLMPSDQQQRDEIERYLEIINQHRKMLQRISGDSEEDQARYENINARCQRLHMWRFPKQASGTIADIRNWIQDATVDVRAIAQMLGINLLDDVLNSVRDNLDKAAAFFDLAKALRNNPLINMARHSNRILDEHVHFKDPVEEANFLIALEKQRTDAIAEIRRISGRLQFQLFDPRDAMTSTALDAIVWKSNRRKEQLVERLYEKFRLDAFCRLPLAERFPDDPQMQALMAQLESPQDEATLSASNLLEILEQLKSTDTRRGVLLNQKIERYSRELQSPYQKEEKDKKIDISTLSDEALNRVYATSNVKKDCIDEMIRRLLQGNVPDENRRNTFIAHIDSYIDSLSIFLRKDKLHYDNQRRLIERIVTQIPSSMFVRDQSTAMEGIKSVNEILSFIRKVDIDSVANGIILGTKEQNKAINMIAHLRSLPDLSKIDKTTEQKQQEQSQLQLLTAHVATFEKLRAYMSDQQLVADFNPRYGYTLDEQEEFAKAKMRAEALKERYSIGAAWIAEKKQLDPNFGLNPRSAYLMPYAPNALNHLMKQLNKLEMPIKKALIQSEEDKAILWDIARSREEIAMSMLARLRLAKYHLPADLVAEHHNQTKAEHAPLLASCGVFTLSDEDIRHYFLFIEQYGDPETKLTLENEIGQSYEMQTALHQPFNRALADFLESSKTSDNDVLAPKALALAATAQWLPQKIASETNQDYVKKMREALAPTRLAGNNPLIGWIEKQRTELANKKEHLAHLKSAVALAEKKSIEKEKSLTDFQGYGMVRKFFATIFGDGNEEKRKQASAQAKFDLEKLQSEYECSHYSLQTSEQYLDEHIQRIASHMINEIRDDIVQGNQVTTEKIDKVKAFIKNYAPAFEAELNKELNFVEAFLNGIVNGDDILTLKMHAQFIGKIDVSKKEVVERIIALLAGDARDVANPVDAFKADLSIILPAPQKTDDMKNSFVNLIKTHYLEEMMDGIVSLTARDPIDYLPGCGGTEKFLNRINVLSKQLQTLLPFFNDDERAGYFNTLSKNMNSSMKNFIQLRVEKSEQYHQLLASLNIAKREHDNEPNNGDKEEKYNILYHRFEKLQSYFNCNQATFVAHLSFLPAFHAVPNYVEIQNNAFDALKSYFERLLHPKAVPYTQEQFALDDQVFQAYLNLSEADGYDPLLRILSAALVDDKLNNPELKWDANLACLFEKYANDDVKSKYRVIRMREMMTASQEDSSLDGIHSQFLFDCFLLTRRDDPQTLSEYVSDYPKFRDLSSAVAAGDDTKQQALTAIIEKRRPTLDGINQIQIEKEDQDFVKTLIEMPMSKPSWMHYIMVDRMGTPEQKQQLLEKWIASTLIIDEERNGKVDAMLCSILKNQSLKVLLGERGYQRIEQKLKALIFHGLSQEAVAGTSLPVLFSNISSNDPDVLVDHSLSAQQIERICVLGGGLIEVLLEGMGVSAAQLTGCVAGLKGQHDLYVFVRDFDAHRDRLRNDLASMTEDLLMSTAEKAAKKAEIVASNKQIKRSEAVGKYEYDYRTDPILFYNVYLKEVQKLVRQEIITFLNDALSGRETVEEDRLHAMEQSVIKPFLLLGSEKCVEPLLAGLASNDADFLKQKLIHIGQDYSDEVVEDITTCKVWVSNNSANPGAQAIAAYVHCCEETYRLKSMMMAARAHNHIIERITKLGVVEKASSIHALVFQYRDTISNSALPFKEKISIHIPALIERIKKLIKSGGFNLMAMMENIEPDMTAIIAMAGTREQNDVMSGIRNTINVLSTTWSGELIKLDDNQSYDSALLRQALLARLSNYPSSHADFAQCAIRTAQRISELGLHDAQKTPFLDLYTNKLCELIQTGGVGATALLELLSNEFVLSCVDQVKVRDSILTSTRDRVMIQANSQWFMLQQLQNLLGDEGSGEVKRLVAEKIEVTEAKHIVAAKIRQCIDLVRGTDAARQAMDDAKALLNSALTQYPNDYFSDHIQVAKLVGAFKLLEAMGDTVAINQHRKNLRELIYPRYLQSVVYEEDEREFIKYDALVALYRVTQVTMPRSLRFVSEHPSATPNDWRQFKMVCQQEWGMMSLTQLRAAHCFDDAIYPSQLVQRQAGLEADRSVASFAEHFSQREDYLTRLTVCKARLDDDAPTAARLKKVIDCERAALAISLLQQVYETAKFGSYKQFEACRVGETDELQQNARASVTGAPINKNKYDHAVNVQNVISIAMADIAQHSGDMKVVAGAFNRVKEVFKAVEKDSHLKTEHQKTFFNAHMTPAVKAFETAIQVTNDSDHKLGMELLAIITNQQTNEQEKARIAKDNMPFFLYYLNKFSDTGYVYVGGGASDGQGLLTSPYQEAAQRVAPILKNLITIVKTYGDRDDLIALNKTLTSIVINNPSLKSFFPMVSFFKLPPKTPGGEDAVPKVKPPTPQKSN